MSNDHKRQQDSVDPGWGDNPHKTAQYKDSGESTSRLLVRRTGDFEQKRRFLPSHQSAKETGTVTGNADFRSFCPNPNLRRLYV